MFKSVINYQIYCVIIVYIFLEKCSKKKNTMIRFILTFYKRFFYSFFFSKIILNIFLELFNILNNFEILSFFFF